MCCRRAHQAAAGGLRTRQPERLSPVTPSTAAAASSCFSAASFHLHPLNKTAASPARRQPPRQPRQCRFAAAAATGPTKSPPAPFIMYPITESLRAQGSHTVTFRILAPSLDRSATLPQLSVARTGICSKAALIVFYQVPVTTLMVGRAALLDHLGQVDKEGARMSLGKPDVGVPAALILPFALADIPQVRNQLQRLQRGGCLGLQKSRGIMPLLTKAL